MVSVLDGTLARLDADSWVPPSGPRRSVPCGAWRRRPGSPWRCCPAEASPTWPGARGSRAAPDTSAARVRVTAAVDAVDPDGHLVRWVGRRSLALRPAGASDKGVALQRLIVELRPGAVIMMGDDHSDARTFKVLRSRRALGRIDGLAIAAAGHADVSSEVAPSADMVLPPSAAAGTFLGLLASLMARSHRSSDRPCGSRRGDRASGGSARSNPGPGPSRRPPSTR